MPWEANKATVPKGEVGYIGEFFDTPGEMLEGGILYLQFPQIS